MSLSDTPKDLFGDDKEAVDNVEIRVNKRYAKEYESRKQRQELQTARQQGQYDDDSSSSSEEEDEDGSLLSPSVDISILKTIHALRKKDERIYDSSTRFFPEQQDDSSDDEEDEEDKSPKERKHTPKKFKDVIREQIVQQMEQDDDDDNGDSSEDGNVRQKNQEETHHLLYDQEQKELRSAFLESTHEQDDEDDWMVLKKRAKRQEDDDEAERMIQQELEALEKTTTDAELQDPRGEVEDGDKFLLDFIKNKKWIDKDDNDESSSDEENPAAATKNLDDDDDDSMDELERADDFESKYNFRFEQAEAEAGKSGADHSVIGYARSGTMNTLRRKDETRKQKRAERKERKAAERKAKEEQLRRLKNAKREEMQHKLKQIKSVLGHVEGRGMQVDEATMLKLMEGEYDPEKFEQVMNEAYGDEFYENQDTEWKTDLDVRQSLLKDEDGNMIAGLDDEAGGLYDNDDDEEGEKEEDGDEAEGEGMEQDQDWDEQEYYNGEDGEAFAQNAAGDQEETETERKLREKMKDELYKLDYEDIIAGMPTRFKYRSVPKNNYGLSTEEILFAKDATLKNFVSLKKMAPYQEGEYHVNSKKRRRFREMLQQDLEEAMAEQGEQPNQADNEEQGDKEAPKKKRRRQKKGKKKDKEGETNEMNTNPAASVVSDLPNEEDTKSKRKQKKKGKKAQKQGGTVDGTDSNAVDDVASSKQAGEDSKPPAVQGVEINGDDTKKPKKKKHKKKKKSKAVAVEGVSAARLASYNL